MGGAGVPEDREHDRAGDPAVGGDRQGVAGVVVEPGQDLHVAAVGEVPVGHVGLPAFVGLLGREPHEGGLGSFLRGRGHPTGPAQGPVDRRGRHRQAVVVLEVPGDRGRPRVQALAGQLITQGDDRLDRGRRHGPRRGAGAAGAGLERVVALSSPAGHQSGHPPR